MTNESGAVEAWESLFRTQVGIMRALAAEFPIDGLTFNEYDVLFTISREPERRLRLRDLNRRVLLSQPSMSRLIDRLTHEGYLTKNVDPLDKRGAIVTMTDAGFTVYRRVARAHMQTIERIFSGKLTSTETAQLYRLTEKLRCPEAE